MVLPNYWKYQHAFHETSPHLAWQVLISTGCKQRWWRARKLRVAQRGTRPVTEGYRMALWSFTERLPCLSTCFWALGLKTLCCSTPQKLSSPDSRWLQAERHRRCWVTWLWPDNVHGYAQWHSSPFPFLPPRPHSQLPQMHPPVQHIQSVWVTHLWNPPRS